MTLDLENMTLKKDEISIIVSGSVGERNFACIFGIKSETAIKIAGALGLTLQYESTMEVLKEDDKTLILDLLKENGLYPY